MARLDRATGSRARSTGADGAGLGGPGRRLGRRRDAAAASTRSPAARPCSRWRTAARRRSPSRRARRDARYADGLGMLVHQAAHAIALALGKTPPLAPLFAAVRWHRLVATNEPPNPYAAPTAALADGTARRHRDASAPRNRRVCRRDRARALRLSAGRRRLLHSRPAAPVRSPG